MKELILSLNKSNFLTNQLNLDIAGINYDLSDAIPKDDVFKTGAIQYSISYFDNKKYYNFVHSKYIIDYNGFNFFNYTDGLNYLNL